MRTKRIVVAVAMVALMSGGMALAATDDAPAGNSGPAADSSGVDVFQDNSVEQRMAHFRKRYDQQRYSPPEHAQRGPNTCSDNPLSQLLANLFGFEEVMRPCEQSDR